MSFYIPVRQLAGTLLTEYIRMLNTVRFSSEGVTAGMVENPVQHGRSQHGVTHHLGSVHDLFISSEDDG